MEIFRAGVRSLCWQNPHVATGPHRHGTRLFPTVPPPYDSEEPPDGANVCCGHCCAPPAGGWVARACILKVSRNMSQMNSEPGFRVKKTVRFVGGTGTISDFHSREYVDPINRGRGGGDLLAFPRLSMPAGELSPQ